MKKFTILVATDFSKSSMIVLTKALEFAEKMDGKLHVVHVAETSFFSPKEDLESIRKNSYEKLKESFPSLMQENFYCVTGKVKIEIANIAKVLHADMVIIGESGETYFLDEFILGSHTKEIVRYCDVPVLVIKNIHAIEYETILIPTDMSEASAKTIELLATLFPASKLNILNFYYLPYETRLNTYGLEKKRLSEYQENVCEESQNSLNNFISSLTIEDKTRITPFVRRGSLNAQLFNQEVEDIKYDLLAMHTTGKISFYAFDILAQVKNDVILIKQL